MIDKTKPYATLRLQGGTFVLVPMKEFNRLRSKDSMPSLPPLSPDGTYPAVAAGRVSIARSIIRDREAAGLTQKELAHRAGIRVETLNRIEKAKVTPDTATIAKIDRALNAAQPRSARAIA